MYQFLINKICIPFNKIYTEPSSGEFWNSVIPPPPSLLAIILRILGRTVTNCYRSSQDTERTISSKDYNYSKFQHLCKGLTIVTIRHALFLFHNYYFFQLFSYHSDLFSYHYVTLRNFSFTLFLQCSNSFCLRTEPLFSANLQKISGITYDDKTEFHFLYFI